MSETAPTEAAPARSTPTTLFRSASFKLRDAPDDAGDGAMPTMVINFARFDEWTEVDSWLEGHFLEKFERGAFAKTFQEQRDRIRTIFQHGRDPVAGFKPLGAIEDLREESDGAWADVPLLDAQYVREIEAGLRAGLYGASFSFRPTRREIVESPGVSAHNPNGIPEHTIKECMVREFGPVTFPQYDNTSTGVRSLTDGLELERLVQDHPDVLRALLERVKPGQTSGDDQPRTPDASTSALDHAHRQRLALQGKQLDPALAARFAG